MVLERLFAKSGTYPSYEMFSASHFGFLLICSVLIITALRFSHNMNKKSVLKTVRICTVILWAFEISKIIFNFRVGNGDSPNNYIPLYFCSITLYCGILSSCAKGTLKRIGDVFLMIGGIVGGVAYILSPCTTAGMYPAIHFITIQSYVHHSIMIYLGILFITTNYIDLKKKDVIYYASTVVVMSIIAYIVNIFLDTNLMFVSKTYPGTIVEVVYNMSPRLFPLMMTFWQAIPPFVVIYWIVKLYKHVKNPFKYSKKIPT